MLRLASDENFNGDIVRGLLFRLPELNLVRVQDVGLEGAIDPVVLVWAAENDRIVMTHDRATLPDFAYERVTNNIALHATRLILMASRRSVRSVARTFIP